MPTEVTGQLNSAVEQLLSRRTGLLGQFAADLTINQGCAQRPRTGNSAAVVDTSLKDKLSRQVFRSAPLSAEQQCRSAATHVDSRNLLISQRDRTPPVCQIDPQQIRASQALTGGTALPRAGAGVSLLQTLGIEEQIPQIDGVARIVAGNKRRKESLRSWTDHGASRMANAEATAAWVAAVASSLSPDPPLAIPQRPNSSGGLASRASVLDPASRVACSPSPDGSRSIGHLLSGAHSMSPPTAITLRQHAPARPHKRDKHKAAEQQGALAERLARASIASKLQSQSTGLGDLLSPDLLRDLGTGACAAAIARSQTPPPVPAIRRAKAAQPKDVPQGPALHSHQPCLSEPAGFPRPSLPLPQTCQTGATGRTPAMTKPGGANNAYLAGPNWHTWSSAAADKLQCNDSVPSLASWAAAASVGRADLLTGRINSLQTKSSAHSFPSLASWAVTSASPCLGASAADALEGPRAGLLGAGQVSSPVPSFPRLPSVCPSTPLLRSCPVACHRRTAVLEG
ncbi:hypothetical protein WJX73_010104 [Symbiochloris irregularis]|uniref:Uncharacterized protein n=1 Tax=Symbiochloris irregularis TaxID=706552 RepID=A0AAW1NVB5_9CHLO